MSLKEQAASFFEEPVEITLEQLAPVKSQEKEFMFICQVADLEELANADSSEHQEQWQMEAYCGKDKIATCRVRMTHPIGEPDQAVYLLTTKMRTGQKQYTQTELNVEVDAEFFQEFKKGCPSGMVKDRYVFNIPGHEGLKWEIDVFKDSEGKDYPWVKIDLEVSDMRRKLPALPVTCVNTILDQKGKRSEDDEAFVSKLFDTVFRKDNPRFVSSEE